jgi:hypothetical protein
LLGIGAAGGGSSANEGKKLETRLAEMRKLRDTAAKSAAKEAADPKPVMSLPFMGNGAGERSFASTVGDEPTILTATTSGTRPGGVPAGRAMPSKNSNKKKKKKK